MPAPSNDAAAAELSAWIEAARQGSREALGKVLETCRPYLLMIANQELTPDLQAKVGASDLVQETFLKVRDEFPRFQGDRLEDVLGWMRQILLNHLANVRRQFAGTQKRDLGREIPLGDVPAAALLDGLTDPAPTPQGQALAREEQDGVERALAQLPERYQRVIRLRYLDGRSFPEIGQALDCTADAARKLWLRALEQLQTILEPGDDSTPPG